jgi:hypothetical protein
VRRDDAPPPSTAASSTPAAIPPPRRVDGDASRRADPDEPRRAERDEASRVVADSVLYSSSNADVLPPVMRRQQLPSSLLAPSAEVPDDWPFLELLVDQQGAVEQVRLHARQLAPGQTLYRHRMLLAAAKAWQFEPARRNGSAVRYVMRVPLEP